MGPGNWLSPVRVINNSRDRLWCLVSNDNGRDAYPLEQGEASNTSLDIDGVGHFYYGEARIRVPDGRVNGDKQWWRMSSNGRKEDVEILGPSAIDSLKKLRIVGGISVKLYRQNEDDPELTNLTYWLAFPGDYPPERI